NAFGQGRPHAGPTDGRVEESTYPEEQIAYNLRRDAIAVLPRKKSILRIDFKYLGTMHRRLTVRSGTHNQADEFFPAPTVLHKFGREPIEQFGVRRRFAARAEVFAGQNEALLEEAFPDAVGRDAGRQRVIGLHDPLRKVEPRRRFGALLHGWQHRW